MSQQIKITIEIKCQSTHIDYILPVIISYGFKTVINSIEQSSEELILLSASKTINSKDIDNTLKTLEKSLQDGLKQHELDLDILDMRVYCPKYAQDDGSADIKLPEDIALSLKTSTNNSNEIYLKSSWSFGSGSHPSTKAIITELSKLWKAGALEDPVLDIGTGSGILAIIAAKLGANNITALDIDPNAIEEATKNIETNQLADKIKVTSCSIEQLNDKFNTVLANLTPSVLLRLYSNIVDILAFGGKLILTVPTTHHLTDIVSCQEFIQESSTKIDTWTAYTLTKRRT